jgi:hypothetical protein
MTDITSILRSFPVFQFLMWLLGPIWRDPVGRIALITTVAYIIGYSTYSGYLSHFTGGFGSISFSRLGVELSDLITLLPSSLLTIVKVIPKGIKALMSLVFRIVFWLLLPVFIGIFLGTYIRTTQFRLGDTGLQIGFLLYSVSMWVSCYFFWRENKLWQTILGFIQLIGIVLFTIDMPVPSVNSSQVSTQVSLTAHMWFYPSFQAISVVLREASIFVWLLMIFFFLPMIFGVEIGRIAVEEKVLSQITSLVLKQPLSLLNNYEKKKSAKSGSHTYVFPEGVSLFLVETYQNTIACYLIKESGDKNLFVIEREAVFAMSLEPAKLKTP